MKAIIFFAVLLFAAQSRLQEQSHLQELYRGFVLNLPMEVELRNQIMNNGLMCLNNIQGLLVNLFATFPKDFKFKNSEFLHNLLTSEAILEQKIAPQCMMAYHQLSAYLKENVRGSRMIIGSDPTSGHLSAGVAYRVFAQAVDDFLHQRNFEAGEKLAMFYKMDAGLAPIELPPVESYPSIEERDYTPINRTRFINEWMTGFLTELGVTDQAKIDQYVNCMFDLGNVTENAFMNYLQHKEDALMGKIALVEGSLAALDSLSRCNEKVDLEYPINLVWKAFASHPPRFVLKVAANFLLEQPTFVQSVINYEVYLSTTKSFLAGKTFATFPKIFLKDLVF